MQNILLSLFVSLIITLPVFCIGEVEVLKSNKTYYIKLMIKDRDTRKPKQTMLKKARQLCKGPFIVKAETLESHTPDYKGKLSYTMEIECEN